MIFPFPSRSLAEPPYNKRQMNKRNANQFNNMHTSCILQNTAATRNGCQGGVREGAGVEDYIMIET